MQIYKMWLIEITVDNLMSPDHFFDPHECPSERSIRGQKGGLRADKRHLHSGLSIVSVLFTMRILVKKNVASNTS